ncbi:cobalamin biosynthesis protein CobD [Ralstonia pickettii]|nr:cobalamin biosynthesis protein CobD [Ralstonia pickettii]
MVIHHLISMTLALIIDRIVGDPPNWPHPVRWMGMLIAKLDQYLNQGNHKKWKGILLLIIVSVVVFAATLSISWGAYQLHVLAGIVVEALVIATAIAQKDLGTAALRVYHPLSAGDLEKARHEVSMIVGRDTANLDEKGITRATVETVAESIGDGITSPLFWALIGGAPLAMVYRVVNTCDSMVGYKNERYQDFGWAAAKLDDVLNWIPSRMTGFLMMLTNHIPNIQKKTAFKHWRIDARKHASPNSGFLEAAVALFLGVQLGGINYYKGVKSVRAYMGRNERMLEVNDILQTIKIMQKAVMTFVVLLWIGGGVFAAAIAWL